MTPETSEIAALKEVVADYFDGLYHADPDRLARVFHPLAQYASATEGTLLHRTMDDYFAVVAARVPPAASNAGREDRIIGLEVSGPVMARAVLTCVLGDQRYTDWLTLLRLDGRWQVISKVFDHEPREVA